MEGEVLAAHLTFRVMAVEEYTFHPDYNHEYQPYQTYGKLKAFFNCQCNLLTNGVYTEKLQGIYICETWLGDWIALNHLNFSDSKNATLLIRESDLSSGAYMKF